MSIHKDWTKEDNFAEMSDSARASKDKMLSEFLDDVLSYTLTSSRNFDRPGQAVQHYLDCIPEEDSSYIREFLTAKHLDPETTRSTIGEAFMADIDAYQMDALSVAKREYEQRNKPR